MKATLSLMFLLVGLSSSFAQQTQIDRFYFDQGVYHDDSDQAEFIRVTDQGALTGCSHSAGRGRLQVRAWHYYTQAFSGFYIV
jgi:hypothetical protein